MKLPSDNAHHYWWSGYWDGPIDGWVYVRGQFYYYETLGDALIFRHRVYGVYYVPKAERIGHMLRHRSFCHQVGWHCNRKPGEERRWFSSDAKPDYKAWYDQNRKELPSVPKKLLVGVTTLRDGTVYWLDNPNEFSREWQYLDDDEDDLAASGMSASGQDPKGLEAKPASPTAEGGDAHPIPCDPTTPKQEGPNA